MVHPEPASLADMNLVMPPQSLECEQGVLGCMLRSGAAADWGCVHLHEDDFYREPHQRIFAGICRARAAHRYADVKLVAAALDGDLEDCGGTEYLMALLIEFGEPVARNAAHFAREYGKVLRDLARSRALLKAAQEVIVTVRDAPGDAERIAQVAQTGVTRAMEQNRFAGTVRSVADMAQDLEAWLEGEAQQPRGVYGMRTGIRSLDYHLGGLYRQRLVLLKGESKAGKTTLAGQTVFATVSAPDVEGAVLAFTLEGGRMPFLRRYVAWQAQVPRALVDRGGMARRTPDEAARIQAAYDSLYRLPLFVHDETRDIGAIEAEVRTAAMQGPVAGVLIDYAQCIKGGRGQSEEASYRDIAERLQVLANEINAPIVVPSQITVQQSGEVTEKGARAWGDNCTLSIYIMRGEPGEPKYARQRSPLLRVVCDAARDDEPFAPVRVRGDFACNRLEEEEQADEQEARLREYDRGRAGERDGDPFTAVAT
ncbi:MAG: DnaB-like helicase C-terminal domain-containing protein [Candidatus Thermoplasmatota archaeon]|nr:DnaB-like helicase C-terminal domain-containing protein [Candidatus Thermoplasmatota archaeon]